MATDRKLIWIFVTLRGTSLRSSQEAHSDASIWAGVDATNGGWKG